MNDTDYTNRPRLRLEHANGRGTGSALQVFLVPATARADGHFRIQIADQNGKTGFDWDNALSADICWQDCAKLLMVLTGCADETDDDSWAKNRILVKNRQDGTVLRVNLRHMVDPAPGYSLSVTLLGNSGEEPARRTILLTMAEGIGLDAVIRGTMPYVTFGVQDPGEVR